MVILGVAAEREVATHSSILAWETPRTEEPGMLQSMGLQRTGHNCPPNTHTHTHTSSSTVSRSDGVVITTGSNSSGNVNGSSDSSTVEWPYC